MKIRRLTEVESTLRVDAGRVVVDTVSGAEICTVERGAEMTPVAADELVHFVCQALIARALKTAADAATGDAVADAKAHTAYRRAMRLAGLL